MVADMNNIVQNDLTYDLGCENQGWKIICVGIVQQFCFCICVAVCSHKNILCFHLYVVGSDWA